METTALILPVSGEIIPSPENTVDTEMEQLRLARVDEDFTRAELTKVEELRDEFMQRTAEGRHLIQKLDDLVSAKTLAKEVTKTRYEAIRDTILIRAKVVLSKGEQPWGRAIHVNAHVQQGSELNIIDMPKAVAWLELVGMSEVVSISLRGNTGFFKNAKMPVGTLELVVIPTVKIDKEIKVLISPKSYIVESDEKITSVRKISIIPDSKEVVEECLKTVSESLYSKEVVEEDLQKVSESLLKAMEKAVKKPDDISSVRETLGGGAKERRV